MARTGSAPNLVIHAIRFPSWADLGALGRHMRFIRRNHRSVGRVALVSDAKALDVAPWVARRLVAAEVRHFPEAALQAALDWAGEGSRRPGVTLLGGLPDDTIGLSVAGVITSEDYADTIEPLVAAKLAAHARVKLLYLIGPEFERFTAGAVWSDALVGVRHLTDFSRVAVVSDIGWIRHAVRAFAPLIPAEIHVFAVKDLAEAKTWIANDPPAM